ncbi:MAG TPA: hypothetical protein VFM94_05130 [Solirubrobacterales bacterium]|nr:hypothetical protein [Solirubrobacterales bacterium]
MGGAVAPKVKVELAEGVKGDIAELTTLSAKATEADRAEVDSLKRRIAELFLGCEANPHVGELMGSGRHPELADCRRVRFDTESHKGKPRLRLIYRNEPSDISYLTICVFTNEHRLCIATGGSTGWIVFAPLLGDLDAPRCDLQMPKPRISR